MKSTIYAPTSAILSYFLVILYLDWYNLGLIHYQYHLLTLYFYWDLLQSKLMNNNKSFKKILIITRLERPADAASAADVTDLFVH